MVAVRESFHLTPQKYFDWEEQQELRYEYFEGQVYAMTEESLAHGRIGLNISRIVPIPKNPSHPWKSSASQFLKTITPFC
jgi:Uma2 family endonuclease